MDNLDALTDLKPQIAMKQAALSKLCFIKERLENKVVDKKGGVSKGTGYEKKTTRETHTTPQQTKNKTEYKYPWCSYVKQHLPWPMASTSTSTTHNVCVDETSVNA